MPALPERQLRAGLGGHCGLFAFFRIKPLNLGKLLRDTLGFGLAEIPDGSFFNLAVFPVGLDQVELTLPVNGLGLDVRHGITSFRLG